MDELYAFIGVGPAPGVATACFSGERERFGPADHKIWATSQIHGDSVGKGESVPAGLIPPQVTAAINEVTGVLGYLPVDAEWGTPRRSADPRVPNPGRETAAPLAGGSVPGAEVLEESLRLRIQDADEQVADRWKSCAGEQFLLVSRTPTGGDEKGWLVDAAARTITGDDGQDDADPAWSVLGSPQVWQDDTSSHVGLGSDTAAVEGADLPVDLIPPGMLAQANDLLRQLGYPAL